MIFKGFRNIKVGLLLLFTVTVVICGILSVRLLKDGFSFWASGATSYEVTGQVGDFIGGIIGTLFSLAAFYMMYLTLEEQRREHNEEKLEGRFFTLIELHRQNVENLSFNATEYISNTDTTSLNKAVYNGNHVFNAICNQFISCRNELKFLFSDLSEIYESTYLEEVRKLFPNNHNDDFYRHLSIIDVCYCIVLYGVSSQGKIILNNLFKGKYRQSFIDDVLGYISLKPASDKQVERQWKQLSSINDGRRKKEIVPAIKRFRNGQTFKGQHLIQSDYSLAQNYGKAFIVYYGGHQFRLGHYYRLLYQTVSFINEQKAITFSEKYRYVKILRAQLSDYEQIVLFLNSLSQVGRNWEINCLDDNSRKLITRYNLIKNIPKGSLFDLRPDYYYPDVRYEFMD